MGSMLSNCPLLIDSLVEKLGKQMSQSGFN